MSARAKGEDEKEAKEAAVAKNKATSQGKAAGGASSPALSLSHTPHATHTHALTTLAP